MSALDGGKGNVANDNSKPRLNLVDLYQSFAQSNWESGPPNTEANSVLPELTLVDPSTQAGTDTANAPPTRGKQNDTDGKKTEGKFSNWDSTQKAWDARSYKHPPSGENRPNLDGKKPGGGKPGIHLDSSQYDKPVKLPKDGIYKNNQEAPHPYKPMKPGDQGIYNHKPNQDATHPYKPMKPGDQGNYNHKPNHDATHPNKPMKPGDQGIYNHKPNQDATQPYKPMKPGDQDNYNHKPNQDATRHDKPLNPRNERNGERKKMPELDGKKTSKGKHNQESSQLNSEKSKNDAINKLPPKGETSKPTTRKLEGALANARKINPELVNKKAEDISDNNQSDIFSGVQEALNKIKQELAEWRKERENKNGTEQHDDTAADAADDLAADDAAAEDATTADAAADDATAEDSTTADVAVDDATPDDTTTDDTAADDTAAEDDEAAEEGTAGIDGQTAQGESDSADEQSEESPKPESIKERVKALAAVIEEGSFGTPENRRMLIDAFADASKKGGTEAELELLYSLNKRLDHDGSELNLSLDIATTEDGSPTGVRTLQLHDGDTVLDDQVFRVRHKK